jgi:hypothetical protein
MRVQSRFSSPSFSPALAKLQLFLALIFADPCSALVFNFLSHSAGVGLDFDSQHLCVLFLLRFLCGWLQVESR